MAKVEGVETSMDSDLRSFMDRSAVRAVVEGYFTALDKCDYVGIEASFTDDADLRYDVEPYRFTGGREFAEYMRSKERVRIRTHIMANCSVDVNGDTATAETFGSAVLKVADSGPGSIIVTGMSFKDSF